VGYSLLLRESRKPQLLKDGLVQTLALDRIARMLLIGSPERPAAWPLIRAEHVAMARGDVPFFMLRSDETGLFECEPQRGESRSLAAGVFLQSGLDAVREGVRAMSEEELTLELRLIETSFEGKAAGIGESSASDAVAVSSSSISDRDTPLDEDRALRAALEIAHEIRESSLVFKDAHYRIGLEFDDAARVHRVALLGAEMYNGNSGIALFLGVAAHVSRDDRLRRAALENLALTRTLLRRDPAQFVTGIGIGGFEGLGSLIYAFAELSRWVDDPSLIDDARLIARSLTRAHIDSSRNQDVLSGTAGLLFALAALDRVSGSKDAAQAIEHCGRRLVETAAAREAGVGWPLRSDAPPLCGMAHGNAGIAAALFEAWRLGGSRDLRDTALRALAYERALRNEDAKNWPDLRADVPPGTFMSTWCNGAPGIALARSRILAIEDQADLREDLELAVAATKEAALPGGHLCCGMGGIDEILFEVGARMDDAALVELARRRTMSRITRSEHDGRWPRVVVRGLMRGSAGIGLGLLRMSTRGDQIPCVLDLSA
jgi:type 2 lantibiotic biosynthesis protein LanM